jgi:hypothetical protein
MKTEFCTFFFFVLSNATVTAIGISAAMYDDKGRANHDPWM